MIICDAAGCGAEVPTSGANLCDRCKRMAGAHLLKWLADPKAQEIARAEQDAIDQEEAARVLRTATETARRLDEELISTAVKKLMRRAPLDEVDLRARIAKRMEAGATALDAFKAASSEMVEQWRTRVTAKKRAERAPLSEQRKLIVAKASEWRKALRARIDAAKKNGEAITPQLRQRIVRELRASAAAPAEKQE